MGKDPKLTQWTNTVDLYRWVNLTTTNVDWPSRPCIYKAETHSFVTGALQPLSERRDSSLCQDDAGVKSAELLCALSRSLIFTTKRVRRSSC